MKVPKIIETFRTMYTIIHKNNNGKKINNMKISDEMDLSQAFQGQCQIFS